jgi:hypothetical protein
MDTPGEYIDKTKSAALSLLTGIEKLPEPTTQRIHSGIHWRAD